MNKNLLMGAAVSALAALAMSCTTGQGPSASETREVGPFTRVDVGGGIGVTITIGAAGPLTLTAQDNIRPLITTEVVEGTLMIHSTGSYQATAEVDVAVSTPSIEGLSASGGSAIDIADLSGDALTLELTGGSRVNLDGTVDTIDLSASGGSRSETDGLAAKTVTVDLSGGSVALVQASDSVSGSASGGSSLTVQGGARLDVESSGGSTVTGG